MYTQVPIIYNSDICAQTKRRRSDPVLWQKPLHKQKCPKGKMTTQTTPQKKVRLNRADRLRTVIWSNYSLPNGEFFFFFFFFSILQFYCKKKIYIWWHIIHKHITIMNVQQGWQRKDTRQLSLAHSHGLLFHDGTCWDDNVVNMILAPYHSNHDNITFHLLLKSKYFLWFW